MSTQEPPRIAAEALALMLDGQSELALLDLREEGVHAQGHPFWATSLPLSRLELSIRRAVPRFDTPIVLIADDRETAQLGWQRLTEGGYRSVRVLTDGVAGWRAAGGRLFSGIHVPSKAFGEVVEHACLTPRINANEAAKLMRRSEETLFVDSRPLEEFRDFSLAAASDCPGAELLLRAPAAAGSRSIVVNCAGRTRSIIGAQSLINAGVAQPVVALENGTMGWHLAGRPLERGASRMLPLPIDAAVLNDARGRAAALAAALGVRRLSKDAWRTMMDDPSRTTFCFDVRLPEDYQAGHPSGFINAPGGQLIQSTERYAPVRHARIVLFDTHAVQAPMTAHWLVQMGWDVWLAPGELACDDQRTSAFETGDWLWPPPAGPELDGKALRALLNDGQTTLIDCGDSRAYRRAHLRGAQFLTRSRIPTWLRAGGPACPTVTFTSEDGWLARYAAADARALGWRASAVAGGTRAAAEAVGLEQVCHWLCPSDDAWYSPYQLDTGIDAAMRDYIAWETGLLEQLDAEPGVRFRVYRPQEKSTCPSA